MASSFRRDCVIIAGIIKQCGNGPEAAAGACVIGGL